MRNTGFAALCFLSIFFVVGCSSYFGQTKGVDVQGQRQVSSGSPSVDDDLLRKMDVDGSGMIDEGDFDLFNETFNSGIYNGRFDYDRNGVVDFEDFFVLQQHWGAVVYQQQDSSQNPLGVSPQLIYSDGTPPLDDPIDVHEAKKLINVAINNPDELLKLKKRQSLALKRTLQIASNSGADFNLDGKIDFDDFFLFADNFGRSLGQAEYDVKFDLSKNNHVDFDDFFILAENFGKRVPKIYSLDPSTFDLEVGDQIIFNDRKIVLSEISPEKTILTIDNRRVEVENYHLNKRYGIVNYGGLNIKNEILNYEGFGVKASSRITISVSDPDVRYSFRGLDENNRLIFSEDRIWYPSEKMLIILQVIGTTREKLSEPASIFIYDGKIRKDIPSKKSIEEGGDFFYITYSTEVSLSEFSDSGQINLTITIPYDGNLYIKNRSFHIYRKDDYKCVKTFGGKGKTIKFFVLPDGIVSSQDFSLAVKEHLAYSNENNVGIFSVEPFKSKKDKFDIIEVRTEKGFGCGDALSNSCSKRELIKLINSACGGEPPDAILVLSTSLPYGWDGYASWDGLVVSNIKNPKTTVHEIGHAFGGLADEYWNAFADTHLNFDPPDKVNQDVAGCPKWCSGKLDSASKCYPAYIQWVGCVEPFKQSPKNHKRELGECWADANEYSRKISRQPLYDCSLGLQCRYDTQCYFTSWGVSSYRHIANGVMNVPFIHDYPQDYRYGIISEEAIQGIIDSKTQFQAAQKPTSPRNIVWYDSFNDEGTIISGGEIDFDRLDKKSKSKILAKALELSGEIQPEESQHYEEKIESTFQIKAAKPSLSDPEIQVIDKVVDFEKKDVDLENVNIGLIIGSYLNVTAEI